MSSTHIGQTHRRAFVDRKISRTNLLEFFARQTRFLIAIAVRRCTVEHVFGTIKVWIGATHFRTRGLKNVATDASLAILAYNIKSAIADAGVAPDPQGVNRVSGADSGHRKQAYHQVG